MEGFFAASDGTYGYRRIHADLAEEGTECSPELVRQIMRTQGLIACQPRPFRVTTDADAEAAATMPDLVERDFTADRPGVKFVGDTTYIHTWAGFIYLATVSDCYSKKVVGWSIADHMRTELVETALKNAAATSVIEPLAVFHSDRGSVDRLNSPSSGPGPLPASAPLRAAVVASAPGGRVRGTRSVGASVLGALRRHHLVFRDPRG
ncbi:transposase InsO family protein [Nocardioides aromaticivorans]|uniref:Transposase InsO family protein n=1 Tax=Nocardioides aromaticivorans TaxID=200618 RepID=A0A7Z0CNG5_9ACTN|nr:transposase InsO family protein [Nocardioides aromaticivorans]